MVALPARAADSAAPGVAIERTEWTGRLAEGGTLSITNRFGDIRARFGGWEEVVEVRAVIQQSASEGSPLGVESSQVGKVLMVVVGSRDGAGSLVTEPTKEGIRRVDLVVFVPNRVELQTLADDGYTDVRGLRGDLRARSGSGPIHVRRIRGDLDVASDSGPIVVSPASLGRTTAQRIESRSGPIELYLAEDGDFAVLATTSGHLTTDFSLEVARDAQVPERKRASARIGRGTTPLALASGTGGVTLARKPSASLASRDELDDVGDGQEQPE